MYLTTCTGEGPLQSLCEQHCCIIILPHTAAEPKKLAWFSDFMRCTDYGLFVQSSFASEPIHPATFPSNRCFTPISSSPIVNRLCKISFRKQLRTKPLAATRWDHIIFTGCAHVNQQNTKPGSVYIDHRSYPMRAGSQWLEGWIVNKTWDSRMRAYDWRIAGISKVLPPDLAFYQHQLLHLDCLRNTTSKSWEPVSRENRHLHSDVRYIDQNLWQK